MQVKDITLYFFNVDLKLWVSDRLGGPYIFLLGVSFSFSVLMGISYLLSCPNLVKIGFSYHLSTRLQDRSDFFLTHLESFWLIYVPIRWHAPIVALETHSLPQSPRGVIYSLLDFNKLCWIYIFTPWMPCRNGNYLLSTVRLGEFCARQQNREFIKNWDGWHIIPLLYLTFPVYSTDVPDVRLSIDIPDVRNSTDVYPGRQTFIFCGQQ